MCARPTSPSRRVRLGEDVKVVAWRRLGFSVITCRCQPGLADLRTSRANPAPKEQQNNMSATCVPTASEVTDESLRGLGGVVTRFLASGRSLISSICTRYTSFRSIRSRSHSKRYKDCPDTRSQVPNDITLLTERCCACERST